MEFNTYEYGNTPAVDIFVGYQNYHTKYVKANGLFVLISYNNLFIKYFSINHLNIYTSILYVNIGKSKLQIASKYM